MFYYYPVHIYDPGLYNNLSWGEYGQMPEQSQLVRELSPPHTPFGTQLLTTSPTTQHIASNNFHSKAKPFLVHKRYHSTSKYQLVIQCTILKELGVSCEANQNILVNIAVDKYVQKGTTTVIINKLVRNSFVEGFSQNSFPHMSQALKDVSNNAEVLYPTNQNVSDFADLQK